MKNIRNYRSEYYSNKDEFEEVEPDIYKTMEKPSTNGIHLMGIEEEEANIIRNLNGWKKGETDRDDSFYLIEHNGKIYYKYIGDEDDDEVDNDIYIEVPLKEIYVTSIVFEQEPEYNENDPSDEMISQYPMEDILDEFCVYCGEPYAEENKNDKVNSYVEFVSPDIEDIRKVRTIIGKHVYNIDKGEYVELKIE